MIKGIDECDNLFTLRNILDTDKIKVHVDNKNPKHAVVMGGGVKTYLFLKRDKENINSINNI